MGFKKCPSLAGFNCPPTVISRNHDSLIINTHQKTVTLLSNDSSHIGYFYLGTLKNPPFHIILAQYKAKYTIGSSVLLINAITGDSIIVDDLPVPSPDGSRIAVGTLPYTLFFTNKVNSLSIWKYNEIKRDFVREWFDSPPNWWPGYPFWISNMKIGFPRYVDTMKSGELMMDTVYLIRNGESWIYQKK